MSARARRLLRSSVAGFSYYSGLFAFWRFFRNRVLDKNEVCVLGLHRVLTRDEQSRSNSLDGMILNDFTFVRLLEYLKQRFQVVSLETLFEGGIEKADRTKPLCLLTFDDGWTDTYATA
jgi:hypothetical protein